MSTYIFRMWYSRVDKGYMNGPLMSIEEGTCRSPEMDKGFGWQTWTRVSRVA